MKPLHRLTDDELMRALRDAVLALPDAPSAWQSAAFDLWPEHGATGRVRSAAQSMIDRVMAALSFDNWATPAFAPGLRQASGTTRHLLYSTQGRDIDLRIVPHSGRYAIAGQILGPDASGVVELRLLAGDASSCQTAPLDDLGEFRLGDLAAGTYGMTLRLATTHIELPPIEVGERGS